MSCRPENMCAKETLSFQLWTQPKRYIARAHARVKIRCSKGTEEKRVYVDYVYTYTRSEIPFLSGDSRAAAADVSAALIMCRYHARRSRHG